MDLFDRLGTLTGASADQIKLITCLLVNYPLGNLYVRLPQSRPELRHLFSIVVSAFFLLFVFDQWKGTLQLLGSVIGAYILTSMRSHNMPWMVFIFVMGHLTFNHIFRAIYDIPYETFDITGPQMVITMKLTTFAWNVWDGRQRTEDLDKWQTKHRVVSRPSLLEFLGYAFYFPGLLVGPYTEYATYASLVDGSLFSSQGTPARNHIPHGRKRVAYRRMLLSLAFLAFFALYGKKYQYASILADSWLHKSFLHRFFSVQVLGFVTRTKYYAAWMLSEGGSIITGLGFTGFTPSGNSRWDGASNVNVSQIEWPDNPKMIFDSWNIKTNVWLRECVYKRIARKGQKPGFKSRMATFIVSAFWHGFRGGYYLSFLLGGFFTATGQLCRKHLRPLVLPPKLPSSKEPSQTGSRELETHPPRTIVKIVYDFFGSAGSLAMLNFTVAPFVLEDFKASLKAWHRMDWYGIWIVGGAMCVLVGGRRQLDRLTRGRVKRAESRAKQ